MSESEEIDQGSYERKPAISTREWLMYTSLVITVLGGLGVRFVFGSGSADAQNALATVNQVKDQLTDVKGRCSALESEEHTQEIEMNELKLTLQKLQDQLDYQGASGVPSRRR